MNEDFLTILLAPVIFSMMAGIYGYLRVPERRSYILLAMILIQMVGSVSFRFQPSDGLLMLLVTHVMVITLLLARHIQNSKEEQQDEKGNAVLLPIKVKKDH